MVARIDDVVTIQTPEGVELDLTLAGLGSRFGAAFIDAVLLFGVLLVESLAVAAAVSRFDSMILLVGVQSAVLLTSLVLYFVLFEILNAGQTPGKAAFGIRVVDGEGQPIRFLPSVLRNLLRLVDFLPVFYLAGSISILVSGDNRRIGDLAADSIVIQDRRGHRAPLLLPDPARFGGWRVSGVSPDELTTVRRLLERLHELDGTARAELVPRIARPLREKVDGGEELSDEAFLRALLALETRNRRDDS